MNHTHEYTYHHAHLHEHTREMLKEIGGFEGHSEGHQHVFAQTHDHGKGGATPHSHKARQFHPGDDNAPGGYKEHHGEGEG